MKKQFLNLGKTLNKAEQRSITGGNQGADPGSVSCKCFYNSGSYKIGWTETCDECDSICTEWGYPKWQCVG